jgi:hypothetical protein
MAALHTIAELTDDRVLYRDLQPVDPELPGLRELAPELGIAPGRLPRKRDADYARVVLGIARIAQQRRGEELGALLVLGDTENDRRLGLGLAEIAGAPTFTFIGVDAPDLPVELRWEGTLAQASRWFLIDDFLEQVGGRGAHAHAGLVILADIDKTLLGPRGRSDGSIDSARVDAAEATATQLLGSELDAEAFRAAYKGLCHSRFHPFTEDNQDYVAYTALLTAAGVLRLEELRSRLDARSLGSFLEVASRASEAVPPRLAPVHKEVLAALHLGDPTPFKAFRHQEFVATVRRMESGELPLCGELFAALTRLKDAGALCVAASDKPAEASLPDAAQRAEGLQALHRTPAMLKG